MNAKIENQETAKNILKIKKEVYRLENLVKIAKNCDQALISINKLVPLYTEVEILIENQKKIQGKKDPKIQNWRPWEALENFKDLIRDIYIDCKSIYHDLHWDQYQFNAY